jgi:hypothetical protein
VAKGIDKNKVGSGNGPTFTSSSHMNTLDSNQDYQKAFIKRSMVTDSHLMDTEYANFRKTQLTGVRSSGFLPLNATQPRGNTKHKKEGE